MPAIGRPGKALCRTPRIPYAHGLITGRWTCCFAGAAPVALFEIHDGIGDVLFLIPVNLNGLIGTGGRARIAISLSECEYTQIGVHQRFPDHETSFFLQLQRPERAARAGLRARGAAFNAVLFVEAQNRGEQPRNAGTSGVGVNDSRGARTHTIAATETHAGKNGFRDRSRWTQRSVSSVHRARASHKQSHDKARSSQNKGPAALRILNTVRPPFAKLRRQAPRPASQAGTHGCQQIQRASERTKSRTPDRPRGETQK